MRRYSRPWPPASPLPSNGSALRWLLAFVACSSVWAAFGISVSSRNANRANPNPMTDQIKASLVLYSGRPDPHWTIQQPEAIAHIQQSLRNLSEAPPPKWPGLGWRGFMLEANQHSLLPGIVRVFEGTICITEDNGRRCYADRDHLEEWLRSEAVHNGLGPQLPQKPN